MSLSKALPGRVITVMHAGGERRAYLVNGDGIEDDYSALFVTARLRAAGLSLATQQASLNAINVLGGYCRQAKVDLLSRFRAGVYLTDREAQALSDFAQQNFGAEAKRHRRAVELGKVRRGYEYKSPTVQSTSHFARLSYIADFLDWLAHYLLNESNEERSRRILEMRDFVLAKRISRAPTRDDFDDREYTSRHNSIVNELICPGSTSNPFTSEVQPRNQLIIELPRQLGCRRGEILNIQVRDIDQVKRQVWIRRRHDAPEDMRVRQPLVKTRGRPIPISAEFLDLLLRYVAVRRTVPGATRHRYLLVTHKAGPTQGQPMTVGAVYEVFNVLRRHPSIAHIRPHLLRHFFNNELAREQQNEASDPNARETHRRVRNFIAGREPHSDVDDTYTQMETKRLAREAVLKLQERAAAATRQRKADE